MDMSAAAKAAGYLVTASIVESMLFVLGCVDSPKTIPTASSWHGMSWVCGMQSF